MGSICIYKGLSDECYKEIKGSGKICDILKSIYPNLNLNNFILIKQGSQISSDYEIKDSEVVFLREAPHATGCMIACAVIGVVTAAVGAGLAIKNYYDQKDLQEEMEDAERDSKNLSQQVKLLPFIKGASNRTALGYNIPFVMGSVYHTPYLLTNGFYSIDGPNGEQQFWNAVFVAGFSNMLCNNISIGNARVVGYNKVVDVPRVTSSSQTVEKVYYMRESDDPYMFHSGSYYDARNRIEIRTADEMTLAGLDEKVSCTSYGDEIPHNFGDASDYQDGVVKQCASNTRKIEICINFNGLRQYNDRKWKSKKVELSFYWSNNASSGSPTWNKFTSISPELNSDKTVRFSVDYTFSAAQAYNKDIFVKIVRETPKNEQNSQEDCYLCYINCWQYDAWKSSEKNLVPCRPLEQPWRDKTLRLGLRIISNDSTKDSLGKINFMAYGMARIVLRNENGSYYWSTEKYPTRNPASWVLEVLTSDVHKHSQYADSEIDLDSLKDLYLYCADNEFYCDGIVTDDTKKLDLVTQILTECNATMYMDSITGKWIFAIEKEQTVPVALLNEQSIKNITISKNFERKPYAQKVTFTDRTNWSVNTVYISKTGTENSADIYDKQNVITESTVKYITTYNHCYKYTKRQIARQFLQPREVTVDVGNEGDYYPLYSMVLLQMQHLKIGLSSGVIHKVITNASGQIEKIQTSDICDFSDTSKTYGVIVQSTTENGKETLYLKVAGTGKTRVLALKTPATYNILPEYGNIYSFGYLDDNGEFTKITNKMTIYGAKPSNNGWQLTLKDYSDDLFIYGDIPSYVPNLSENREIETRMPTPTYGDIQSRITEVKAEVSTVSEELNLNLPPDVPIVTAVAEKDGIRIRCDVDGRMMNNSIEEYSVILYKSENDGGTVYSFSGTDFFYSFNRISDGYPEKNTLSGWKVKAKAQNFYGLESAYSDTVNINTDKYGTWKFTFSTNNINEETLGRTVIMNMTVTKAGSDTISLYGDTKFKISIKRNGYVIDKNGIETSESIADSKYYAPNLEATAYPSGTKEKGDYKGNENNYKDIENSLDYVISGSTFTQTLPLYGQEEFILFNENWIPSGKKRQNTEYSYKISAYNESGFEITLSNFSITALCSGLTDIVYSHDYYKNLYVKKLSAINANLGLISQGGFGDFSGWNNFWALSYLTAEESGVTGGVKEGAFKVGDSRQYIMAIPPRMTFGTGAEAIENNTDNFMIKIKAGNIELQSSGPTAFEGGTYITDDVDPTKRTHLTSTGIEVEKFENGEWIVKASIIADTYGNMIITNVSKNDSSLPRFGTALNTTSIIYHLEGNTKDDSGENKAGFTFNVNNYSESTLITNCNKLMNGSLKKTLAAECICGFTNTDIVIGDNIIDLKNGTVKNPASEWNSKLGVGYFQLGDK